MSLQSIDMAADTENVGRPRRLLKAAASAAGAAILLLAGAWIGTKLVSPGPVVGMPGELQQIETTGGTYLGRVQAEEDGYLRLLNPAILTVEAVGEGADSQAVVRSLRTEPYGLGSEILVSRAQVVFVASVADDSQLARAYARAVGR